jgi:hypothetical protein
MYKKITTYLSLIILIFGTTSAITSNPNADVGNTGATGTTCATSCHNSFAINAIGGSVITAGLPTGNYVAGQSYPFTLTIKHATANRLKWGFAIKAVNAANGAAIGTFTTTNTTNVRISSNEATSKTAPTTAAAATYTFTGITWKAPAAATAPVSVKFYYVGNAANGDNARTGDYIYTGSTTVALPIILTNFTTILNGNNVLLNWQVESDITTNFFEIEKSTDGSTFETISKIIGSNLSIARKYSYVDTKPNKLSTVYYRLKMVDNDGSVTYSKIEKISLTRNTNYVSNVYPNPVKKGQTINVEVVSDKEQIASFIIFNTQGKIVSAKEKAITQGHNNISLKLGNFLTDDNYHLQVKIGNTVSKQFNIAIVE